jgi:dTDP-4-dehydrorhamnose 3,5-epimerase
MDIVATAIPNVVRITPRRFGDARGWFSEVWSARRMAEQGLDVVFVQDNHSYSAQTGTVRGLHYQRPPNAQGKLVRVLAGAVRDVAVDVRRGSPTYGHWVAEELSAENGAQLWVPRGFLHGFVTLAPDTHVLYKVDGLYAPDCDGAIRFDDPDVGIDWGIDPGDAVLSDKDAAAPAFAAFDSPFRYGEPS